MKDTGRLFEYIKVNTEDKMWELYNTLSKDASRMAHTYIFFIGEIKDRYYVYYRPTSRRVISIMI